MYLGTRSQLEDVCGMLAFCTTSNWLLLSKQDKKNDPALAQDLPHTYNPRFVQPHLYVDEDVEEKLFSLTVCVAFWVLPLYENGA